MTTACNMIWCLDKKVDYPDYPCNECTRWKIDGKKDYYRPKRGH